jgi:hypothetical protein
MYTHLYLSFKDEAEAQAVLYRMEGAVEADEENGIEAQEGYEVPNYRNIDTIGIIYKPTGEMLLGEDGEYPDMQPIESWHVNIALCEGEDAEALEGYEVHPKSPVRIWG